MMIFQQLCLGIGLASATGLRAFLPLLGLAIAAHFGFVHLNREFAWLGTTAALTILAVAALAEIAADKVPLVDHGLDAVQTVVRPVAGALAVAGTLPHLDPTTAAIVGLLVGAPLAGSLHVAKSGARLASTATTAGFASPLLSMAEDGTSLMMTLLALFVPVLGAVVALTLVLTGWRLWRRFGRRRKVVS